MAENIRFFLSLPLWFTVPIIAAYISLLVYIIYVFSNIHQRQKV